MDSYLTIAAEVLAKTRRPLTPRQILKRAYLDDIVPQPLHGRTQHKTLGARLSVDIVRNRENSPFFRTKPGHFFLRSFMQDTSIPAQYREPMIARRRIRDLYQGPVLTIDISVVRANGPAGLVPPSDVADAIRRGRYRYLDRNEQPQESEAVVWSFVMLTRGTEALSYRLGKYREDRDTFSLKRSVGFYSAVAEPRLNLFNRSDLGIVESGIEAIHLDLDMPRHPDSLAYSEEPKIEHYLLDTDPNRPSNLVSVITFECPHWFEPVGRRLAINDLQWLDLSNRVNHIDDFDPWSQKVLQRFQT